MGSSRHISMEELRRYAERLPGANEAYSRCNSPYVKMARLADAPPAYYSYHSMDAYSDVRVDTLEFRLERGRLDGTTVWYWTYNGVIVRVDV